MNKQDQKSNAWEDLLYDLEAETYTGAIRRSPTEMELDELALYYASDLINGDINIWEEEMDEMEKIFRIKEEKEQQLKELKNLTGVIDYVRLNIQVFEIYNLTISKNKVNHKLRLNEGKSILIKRNGVLKELYEDKSIVIDL